MKLAQIIATMCTNVWFENQMSELNKQVCCRLMQCLLNSLLGDKCAMRGAMMSVEVAPL